MINRKKIAETALYILYSEFEDAFLIDKNTQKELFRTSFYGDASCGLIAQQEWVVVAGDNLVIWINDKLTAINDDELKWIAEIRQIGDYEVEILTDPWSENSAIWKFDIKKKTKVKVSDFYDYKNKKHTEDIKW